MTSWHDEMRAQYGTDAKADLLARLKITKQDLSGVCPRSATDETLYPWYEFNASGFARSEPTRFHGEGEFMRIRDGLIAAIERLEKLATPAEIQAERSRYVNTPFPQVVLS